MAVRSGHNLREYISAFDAPFFSISATDAELMDPQQRKMLETTFRALEDGMLLLNMIYYKYLIYDTDRLSAGLPMEQVTGSKTSVYVGCFTNDWQHISFKDSEQCGTTAALGTQACFNANRVSWFFDFKGNSANIDTACSSSLVALDAGCKGLRNGEADLVSQCVEIDT